MFNILDDPDKEPQNQEDREKELEEMGVLHPISTCELCGRPTRNIYHCTPTCEDCEEITRRGN